MDNFFNPGLFAESLNCLSLSIIHLKIIHYYQLVLNNGLAIASLNDHGIEATINTIASPKNSSIFLCLAASLPAFFTVALPMCTSIQANNIMVKCSIVKKRVYGSFILLPKSFNRANQPLLKYNIKPINNCISQLIIKKRLLRLSLAVNLLLPK
jgi:hypothetical protein